MSQRTGSQKKQYSELVTAWLGTHWPPRGMSQLAGEANIYQGTHEQLTLFSNALAELMLQLEDHINDTCRGRIPRWMKIPKLAFDVERINLVQAQAKDSRRFANLVELQATCGALDEASLGRVRDWFDRHSHQELIGHLTFQDRRAFVYVRGAPEARRLRYWDSGLAVAAPTGGSILVQDQRGVVRRKRKDALSDPIARSRSGWSIYAPSAI